MVDYFVTFQGYFPETLSTNTSKWCFLVDPQKVQFGQNHDIPKHQNGQNGQNGKNGPNAQNVQNGQYGKNGQNSPNGQKSQNVTHPKTSKLQKW